jgi:hypothetical protein
MASNVQYSLPPYLWPELMCKLRFDLDCVVAPLRVHMLHVCVTLAASAIHIGTYNTQWRGSETTEILPHYVNDVS